MTPEITNQEFQFLLKKLEQAPLANLKEAQAVMQLGQKLAAFVDFYIKNPLKEIKEPNV